MEAQMKRGFLEACVLAAVSGEESYGYHERTGRNG